MKRVWRATIEASLIVFALYTVLLMKEFGRFGLGRSEGLIWAIGDIFTPANSLIAVVTAVIGCILLELLPKKV